MCRLGDVSCRQSSFQSAYYPCPYGSILHTCWFINRMPISFLSFVNFSNASSIAESSVLPSTTRKFFCESGGAVTCYTDCKYIFSTKLEAWHTPIPASSSPVTES
jgi:hypothetical protein